MKRSFALLAALLWASSAFAQGPGPGPGPGPVPDPWVVDGATISYNNGGITVPATVPGGTKGAGTINANAIYVQGNAMAAVAVAGPPLTNSISGGVNTITFNKSTEFGISGNNLTFATTQPNAHTWQAGQTFQSTVTINLNTGSAPAPIAGAMLNGVAADGVVARSQLNAYGAIASFTGVIYGGTNASPTAVTSGTQLTGINAYAYNGASIVGPIVSFRTYAAENIASGHQGSQSCIATTTNAATTLTDRWCVDNTGGLFAATDNTYDIGASAASRPRNLYVANNAFFNNYFGGATNTVSAGGTTILTSTSTRFQALTGSLGQTYQLPNATTLPLGPAYVFNDNSSGSLTVTNAGGSTQYTVPAGGFVTCGPTDNSTPNGAWDCHPAPPLTVTWGSGTTGLVMNSALSTTAAISAGASSSTVPVFIPQRGTSNIGIGGDGTHLYGIVGGAAAWTSSSSGTTIPNLTATTSFTATGLVTNADLANAAAYTFKGNATGSSAAPTDFTIGGLTNKASPTGSDLLVLSDQAASGAIKYCTITQCLGAVTSGVSSVNTSTGALTLANGNGIAAWAGAGTATLTVSADIASGSQFLSGTANKLLDAATIYQAETTTTFGTTTTFDFNTFYNTKVTLTANITTITCSNQKAGQSGTIRFIQDATGSRTIPATFGCNMKFASGTQPVLSTAANAVDALVYSCSATNYCVGSLIKAVQ